MMIVNDESCKRYSYNTREQNMNTYESEKYFTDLNNLRKTIDTFGVAVIPNVLSYEECERSYQEMWNYFEHISQSWDTPLKQHDEKTYKSFWNLFPIHSMLLQHWNVGHAQFVWDLRQNENIINTFSQGIWGCKNDELLVSFDGISMHLPPEITKKGWYRGNKWYHTDQSYLNPGFQCVQSFVTLRDVNVGDATLGFMEKSHKFHEAFQEHFGISDKKDWYKLNEQEEEFYIQKGCTYKRISCPQGSMVFWDSRTIHCGVEPMKQRQKPNIRSIVYICYMPRKLCSSANIKKKHKALNEMRMTSHWPCKPKLFGKKPRTYGKEIQEITLIEPPILNRIGMKLAGF